MAVVSPIPRLAREAGHEETQSEADEGVDGSDDPEGGRDGPRGLVENPPDHGDDDDEGKAQDGAHLYKTKRTHTAETQLICHLSFHDHPPHHRYLFYKTYLCML